MHLFWQKKEEEKTEENSNIFEGVKNIKRKSFSFPKRYLVIEVDLNKLKIDFEKYKVFFHYFLFSLVLIFVLVFSFNSKADVANFYSQNCLGNWENPKNAEGVPNVESNGKVEQFSPDNSAVLNNTTAQLFCGNFTGKAPEDYVPKKFILKFSILASDQVLPNKDPLIELPKTEINTTTNPDTNSDVNTTPENINEVSAFLKNILAVTYAEEENPTPAVESSPAPTPAPESVPTLEQTPTLEPTPDSSTPTEIIPTTENANLPQTDTKTDSNTPDQTQSTESVNENTSDTSTENVNSENTATNTTTNIATENINNFLEVAYTLDGTDWKKLGYINEKNLADPSFEIPLESLDWQAMSKIQISVTPVVSIDKTKIFYIDSMWIEGEYDKLAEIPKSLPKISVEDPSALGIIINTDTEFTSNENPSFTVKDPELSNYQIAKLVSEEKATVIEDKDGVLDGLSGLKEKDGVVVDNNTEKIDTPPASESVLKDVTNTITNTLESIVTPTETPPILLPEAQPKEEVTSFLSINRAYAIESNQVYPKIIEMKVLDFDGKDTEITATSNIITINGKESSQIKVNKPKREFRPGKYTLQITLATQTAIIETKQDFIWGVLVVNMDKSIYQIGDKAFIQMGVIDDSGHTICAAKMEMQIISPSGIISNFSTEVENIDKKIIRDSACGPDNVILTGVPDYHVYFPNIDETGEYRIKLMAETMNGTKTIEDGFSADNNILFDVSRVTASRIQPTTNYPVSLYVKANKDFDGVITEKVPNSFQISNPKNSIPFDKIEESLDEKILSWNLKIKKGEEKILGYYYDAPNISPELFFLGPLEFKENDTTFFKENRKWQIASDATCSATTTGNWNTGSNWTGCSGTGGIPGAGDNITINSGVTITMDTNSPVLGTITIASTGVLDTSSSNYSLSGTTINIQGTLTANASTITLSGTSGTLFTRSGTFNNGTSTVTISSDADVTLTSGTITFYNLYLTPTITGNHTYTFGSGALTINGDFTINPTASSSYLLTVNMGAAITVASGKTTTITRTTSATSKLDTRPSSVDYNLTTGFMNLATGGTIDCASSASTITLKGTSGTLWTQAGTFTMGSSTVSVTSDADVTIASGSGVVFSNLSFTPTITGNHTYTLGTTGFANSFTINPNASSGLTLTVNMSQSLSSSSGGDLTIKRTGSALAVFDPRPGSSDYSFYVTHLDIQTGGTLDCTGYSGTIRVGTWATSGTMFSLSGGTFTPGSSTVVLTSYDANVTLTSGTISFYNLTVNNAGASMTASRAYTFGSSAITVSNNFTVQGNSASAFTLTVNMGADITVTGTTTINRTSSALTVLDTRPSSSDYNLSTGFLNIDTGGTLDATGASSTITLKGTSGTLWTQAGTFNAGTSTVIMNPDAAVTLVSGNSNFYNLSLTPTITAARTYTAGTGTITTTGDFTINPTASSSYLLTVNMGNSISVTKTLTITKTNSATAKLDPRPSTTDYNITAGFLNIDTGGTLDCTSSALTITLFGTSGTLWTQAGTFTITSGTPTVVFSSNADVTLTSGTITFYNLYLTPTITANHTYTFGSGALTINGDFTINPTTGITPYQLTVNMGANIVVASSKVTSVIGSMSATSKLVTTSSNYQLTSGTLLIGGSCVVDSSNSTSIIVLNGTSGNPFVISDGSFIPGSGTIRYTGNNTSGNTNIVATTYYNLTVNNASETYVLTGPTTVTNTMRIANGILDAVSGQNYPLTVGGNWNNLGTFTARNGLVTLNSGTTATVSGSTSFYDLTITHTSAKEIDFATTSTPIFEVTHTFTVSGNSSQLIKLYSDTAGTKWQFHPIGTASVSYADVKDGGCQAGAIAINPANSLDSGNNDSCWGFEKKITFSLSSNAVDFGHLICTANRYATDGASSGGSLTEVIAHTISAMTDALGGYVITVQGPTLTNGTHTIAPIGGTAMSPNFGTEQFGIRLTASGGTGVPIAPYDDASKYAYSADANTPSQIAGASSGDGNTTIYSVRYLSNISPESVSGNYSTNLTYVMTGTF